MALSKLVASTAAALLVMAPAVAFAGTRAAESVPAAAKPAAKKIVASKAKSQPGKARASEVAGEKLGAGSGLGFLAGGVIAAGFIAAVTDS